MLLHLPNLNWKNPKFQLHNHRPCHQKRQSHTTHTWDELAWTKTDLVLLPTHHLLTIFTISWQEPLCNFTFNKSHRSHHNRRQTELGLHHRCNVCSDSPSSIQQRHLKSERDIRLWKNNHKKQNVELKFLTLFHIFWLDCVEPDIKAFEVSLAQTWL
jgi:hypothetical protein